MPKDVTFWLIEHLRGGFHTAEAILAGIAYGKSIFTEREHYPPLHLTFTVVLMWISISAISVLEKGSVSLPQNFQTTFNGGIMNISSTIGN